MLDRDAESFSTGIIEYLVTKCCISCLTGMPYFTLLLDPFMTGMPDVSENKWITSSTGMLNDSFDNHAGLDV